MKVESIYEKLILKNVDKVVKLFVIIFLISMINREFLPLGIDLRYIQVLLSLILVGIWIVEKYRSGIGIRFKEIINNRLFFVSFIFYLYIILVNFKWINNGLELNQSEFLNMIILSITNFMAIIIFYLYKDKIEKKIVIKTLIISTILLLFSMIMVWGGIPLSKIMGGDYLGYYPGVENINFFGQQLRVAGYAQDPNYASIFMVISGITSFYWVEDKRDKYIIISLTIFGYMLSASKTIAIAFIFASIFILLVKIVIKKYSSIPNKVINTLVIALSVSPYFIVKLMKNLGGGFNLDTMSTRLVMWENAVRLFESNPIFGGGITSFRSLFAIQENGWYVQSHSTIFQIISEMGIIGIILFISIFILVLKDSNEYIKFITIITLIFCMTSEILHLTLFAFIIGLAPIILNKDIDKRM